MVRKANRVTNYSPELLSTTKGKRESEIEGVRVSASLRLSRGPLHTKIRWEARPATAVAPGSAWRKCRSDRDRGKSTSLFAAHCLALASNSMGRISYFSAFSGFRCALCAVKQAQCRIISHKEKSKCALESKLIPEVSSQSTQSTVR